MSNWVQKLTSRKFWAAVCEFVSMMVLAFGGTENEATKIAAIIMAGAGVVAYIVGEGLVDAASAGKASNTVQVVGIPEEDDEDDLDEEEPDGWNQK